MPNPNDFGSYKAVYLDWPSKCIDDWSSTYFADWHNTPNSGSEKKEHEVIPSMAVDVKQVVKDPHPELFELGKETYTLWKVVDGTVFGCKRLVGESIIIP